MKSASRVYSKVAPVDDIPVSVPHARKRRQQRGVSKADLSLITTYGSFYFAGKGRLAYYVDRQAVENARKDCIDLSNLLGVACIVQDGRIVTVEHAPRIPRHWKGGW